jgi:two-component system alkaline phosphatase synthesis response regulator PhoP
MSSTPPATILIIEDEPELARALRAYLENAGFQVSLSGRGDDGLALWERLQPDLVLLDLNLPGLDGLDVARQMQARAAAQRRSPTPLIMLTARSEEADQFAGLELGADDYITKPFSPRLVVARVRALLRRAQASTAADPGRVRLDDIEIDPSAHTVQRSGHSIELTPTEFTLLYTLAAAPGRAYSRLQLLEAIQGVAYEGYERTIDAHVKNLRAKLEADPKQPRYIETVFGVGYRSPKR